jgi:uncharacterized tellurite resistance protein B-like protein
MRIDTETTETERAAVQRAIRTKFGLTGDEAEALVALAEEEVRQATDYYQFTSLINQHFTQAQKERVLESMWRVACADVMIDAHEQHLLRKIAASCMCPTAYRRQAARARCHRPGKRE